MIKIAICDGQKEYRELVENMINKDFSDCYVKTYSSGEELLQDKEKFDIYILDIILNTNSNSNINGMLVAQEIRKRYNLAVIIFISNYSHFVYQGYEVNAFRYIDKLNLSNTLPMDLSSAIKKVEELRKDTLICDTSKKIHKINLNNITYFEKFEKFVEFHLNDGTILTERITLNKASDKIKHSQFVLIRKGVVINMNYIKTLENAQITMTDDKVYYISRKRMKEVYRKIFQYFLIF